MLSGSETGCMIWDLFLCVCISIPIIQLLVQKACARRGKSSLADASAQGAHCRIGAKRCCWGSVRGIGAGFGRGPLGCGHM